MSSPRDADVADRVAVVTGSTQGLGFALAEGLAQRLAPSDVVYLTGRDPRRVQEAVERVAKPQAQLRGEVLDVNEAGSVEAFGADVEARHGGVDIVVSNAAARLTPETPAAELVGPFVETNNLGATRVLRAFDARLRPRGRLLVVASSFGSLRQLPSRLHARFDTEATTLDDVDSVMLAWRDAVIDGHAAEQGWPNWINVPSKVGQVAAMRVLARTRRGRDLSDSTLVAAVCPGLIDTDASRPWFADMSGAQTPADAAEAPLRLLLEPIDPRHYGELVRFGQVIPWR